MRASYLYWDMNTKRARIGVLAAHSHPWKLAQSTYRTARTHQHLPSEEGLPAQLLSTRLREEVGKRQQEYCLDMRNTNVDGCVHSMEPCKWTGLIPWGWNGSLGHLLWHTSYSCMDMKHTSLEISKDLELSIANVSSITMLLIFCDC